jgi:hypothetical protein
MLWPASHDLMKPWLPNMKVSEIAGSSDGASSGSSAMPLNSALRRMQVRVSA